MTLLLSISKADDPGLEKLGPYDKLSSYYGSGLISKNLQNIPQIGCFYLTAGHVATGGFVTHRVELSVDATGNEVFCVFR